VLRRVEEEFEITDTPPFESPVVAAWNAPVDEEEEELDEESFDDEFPSKNQFLQLPMQMKVRSLYKRQSNCS